MENLGPVTATRKTGDEPLTAAGRPTGLTVCDVWAWGWSDLLGNTERGVLAEFIVAAALGIASGRVREGWAVWDLTTPEGIRIEVKSAAFLQAWAQKKLSAISFKVPETLAWDASTGQYASAAQRHAHVYVFALLSHTDKPTVNPLDLDQWTFYVLPTKDLNSLTSSPRSISLKTLKTLTTAVNFGELAETVKTVHSAASARSYVALMTSAVEHPDIKFVVYPVHMDGTLTGAAPRMRHDPDCGHFKWGDGTVLGTAKLATEEQMRSLRACKSCIRSHRSAGDV